MKDFLDISFSSSRPDEPYFVLRFERGTVVEMTRHAEAAALAAYCQRYDLPVMTGSPQVRTALADYGIETHMYETRAVGEV